MRPTWAACLLRDQHLRSRGYLQEVDRAFIGSHPQPSMPIREGERPHAIRTAAPMLGQHNRESAHLATDGIIGRATLSEEELTKSKTVSPS
ncbi:CoA transferase [Bradyrhizobium sp. SSUT112]|uniref:CoA transferase n=1 Tax=Bradyrhizobium sp. SSUT112 TaxID=3040604 RepID=UPI00244CC32B|nr:CoA transferase [Bradyrhizobium sp. SSUT112]MDH2357773.1 CoA transferase [Bradyrhizobium sp. SSUT112]